MLIFFHVISALSSILITTFAALFPSALRLRASAVSVITTFVSGTYLVIQLHAPVLHACVLGLTYLAATVTGIVFGYYRLRKVIEQ